MTPPSWAPTWCYVYFVAALVGAVSAVVALVMGYSKMSGYSIFALLFLGTLAVIDSMMYFWICRASLTK